MRMNPNLPNRNNLNTNYRYITLYFSAVFVFVVFAFSKTYFSLFPSFKNTTVAIHFHVIMVLLWFTMLIVQPILISKKQTSLHRLIGKISYAFVPLLIFSFLLMTRNEQFRSKKLNVFIVNIFDVSMFLIFYLLAIVNKRKAAWHARFMMLTVIPFLSPASARLHINGLLLQLGLLVSFLIVELFRGKVYKPILIGGFFYVALLLALGSVFIGKPALLDSLWNVLFGQS